MKPRSAGHLYVSAHPMKSIARIFISVLVGAVGVLLLFLSAADYFSKTKHASWPLVNATITNALVEKNAKGWYCPKVDLAYTQTSTPVVANLRFQDPICTPSKESAAKKIDAYSLGQHVQVAADPARPTIVIPKPLSLGLLFYLGIILGPILLFQALRIVRQSANPSINADAAR